MVVLKMTAMRTRLSELSERIKTEEITNIKLDGLYALTQAIGTIRKIDPVLDIITSELTRVMDVLGISVKLLSEDGKFLHYAAAHGSIAGTLKNKVVEVAKSPLNRKVIEGEPFVTGQVTQDEIFQFGEDLAAAKVKSVLFVPLVVDENVTGILGAYSRYSDRFSSEAMGYFQKAASLVAIAIDNARSYEKMETMFKERSWFMMRVAHNIRAPLGATLSILEVLRGNYLGDLNEDQIEYLRRIERRVRTMVSMVNELLILSDRQGMKSQMKYASLEFSVLSGRISRTFKDVADQKGISLDITCSDHLPEVKGDPDLIEQMMENLVSNALRYTLKGGRVSVEFRVLNKDWVSIQVRDNGIGIARDEMPKIFDEFFRAEKAKSMEEHGTGLGMTIVKEIVEQHGGRISVESEEGLGTLFVVHLPVVGKKQKGER